MNSFNSIYGLVLDQINGLVEEICPIVQILSLAIGRTTTTRDSACHSVCHAVVRLSSRSWILEECSARSQAAAAAAVAAEEAVRSPTSVTRLPLLQPPSGQLGEKFFAAAKALWADAAVRDCFDRVDPSIIDKVREGVVTHRHCT